MDEDQVVDTGVEATEQQDNFGDMQDRMEGNSTAWLSESEGAVVDQDGNPYEDGEGNRFGRMEDYEAWKQNQTGKPETESKEQTEQQQNPILSDSPVSPEQLREYAEVGNSYKYNEQLVTPVIEQPADKQAPAVPEDPITRVKEMSKQWAEIAISPIKGIRDALLQNGADPGIISQYFDAVLNEQAEKINELYKEEYEKALEQRLEGKYSERLSAFDKQKIKNDSASNVERLARQYYPKGGKEAFFSLFNGSLKDPTDPNSFQRGPAAVVIDLLFSMANDGKTFNSTQDRTSAYTDTFESMMSDKNKAEAFIDIVHNYWLGRKTYDSQKVVFNKGKEAANKQNARVKQTIRTKPANISSGNARKHEDDGFPDFLKQIEAGNI